MIHSYRLQWRLVFSVFLLVILAACGNGNQTEPKNEKNTKEIKHSLGTANVTEHPERIVTLELGFTELAATLGTNPAGVADDERPERIPQAIREKIEGYQSVGTRSQPNLEVIRSLNPDLIIADVDRHKNIYKELSNIAPTIALKSDTAGYQDVLDATKIVGKSLGKEAEADKLISDHIKKADEMKAKMDIKDKKVLQTGYSSESNTFEVPTSSYFTPNFLTTVGINYDLKDEQEVQQEMTIEQLVTIDPDVLIITKTEDEPSAKDALKNDKLWNELTAVQTNQVYEVDHNDWSRRRSIPAANDIMEDLDSMFVKDNQ